MPKEAPFGLELGAVLEKSMASLMADTHCRFSSAVSARSGNVRVGVLSTNAFSPPPNSSGAFSSTEKPSLDASITISPRGKAS